MYREFNENPQVSLLQEEVKKLKATIEWYRHELDHMLCEVRKQYEGRKMEHGLYERWMKEFEADRTRLTEEMKNFNALPWYKKIRYKFDVK